MDEKEGTVSVEWNEIGDESRVEIDIPHFGFDDFVAIEVRESDVDVEKRLEFGETNPDPLLGIAYLPALWVINSFGVGKLMKNGYQAVFTLFVIANEGESRGRPIPYTVEVAAKYLPDSGSDLLDAARRQKRQLR